MALNALTGFTRSQSAQVLAGPARTGNRDGGEFSATAEPTPFGCRSAPLTLATAGTPATVERSAGMQVGRKWRRKSLERPDSRPEMAPRRARRSASPRPACLRSRVDEAESESPGTSKAAHAGAVHRPRTSSRGAHVLSQWASKDACRWAPTRTQARELNFLIWNAGNPLKSPKSDEGIQEKPSPLNLATSMMGRWAFWRAGAGGRRSTRRFR